ncbi:hypothetical protein DM02DRAFT_297820 [Periconia macrospinosa]|uniref:Uncharacterized protein n=1 Tax=Periconia macrospinosa TaxID=97972 RepID=A0A2V1D4L2_9PLEO|nr:hypothetical protein DM02DRAFT_297820 [Periconia macrospinosa]
MPMSAVTYSKRLDLKEVCYFVFKLIHAPVGREQEAVVCYLNVTDLTQFTSVTQPALELSSTAAMSNQQTMPLSCSV